MSRGPSLPAWSRMDGLSGRTWARRANGHLGTFPQALTHAGLMPASISRTLSAASNVSVGE